MLSESLTDPSILLYLETIKAYHWNSARTSNLRKLNNGDFAAITNRIKLCHETVRGLPSRLGLRRANQIEPYTKDEVTVMPGVELFLGPNSIYVRLNPENEDEYLLSIGDLIPEQEAVNGPILIQTNLPAVNITSYDDRLWPQQSDISYEPNSGQYEELFFPGQGGFYLWQEASPLSERGQTMANTALLIVEDVLGFVASNPKKFRKIFDK
jgi:hypothetical protein